MLKPLIIEASILAVFDRCQVSLCFLQKFKIYCGAPTSWLAPRRHLDAVSEPC